MRKKLSIATPVLVDSDLAVIKSYGLLNEEAGDIPHPTAMIIDKSGKVAYLFAEVDYSVRPDPSAMVDVLESLEQSSQAETAKTQDTPTGADSALEEASSEVSP